MTDLWKKLLDHHPTHFELEGVIKNIPSLRLAAAKELLAQQNVLNESLCCIMQYCEELRVSAWDKFALKNPSDIDLRRVIENVPSLAESAGRMLLDRYPEKHLLFCVMEHVSFLRNEAWIQYRDQAPTNDELRWIIRYIPALQIDAGKMLLRRNPNNADLRCVTVRVKELRANAGKALLHQNPSKDDIQCVLQHVPDLKDEAERLLVKCISEEDLWEFMKAEGREIGNLAGEELRKRTQHLTLPDKEYLHAHAPLLQIALEQYQQRHIRERVFEELLSIGLKTR